MSDTIVVTAPTLEEALGKVEQEYGIEKDQIQYTIRKDAKSGIFGIIPQRDIEIVVNSSGCERKKTYTKKMVKTSKVTKQSAEEELIPLCELSIQEQEMMRMLVQESMMTIIRFIADDIGIESTIEGTTIYVTIEEKEGVALLRGRDLEVLKAIQYVIYKIVTQRVRCLFSLHIALGNDIVSEETLLITMVNKLIEKVKYTQKTQRTYPLNAQQRALVQSIVEQEPCVAIKKQKSSLDIRPVVLHYVGE